MPLLSASDPTILDIKKVELHQHVDGSIPVSLTWSLMQEYGLSPVDTIEELEKQLVMQPEDEGAGLLHYLKSFIIRYGSHNSTRI